MRRNATDTFSWTALEAEAEGGATSETVDFADILAATRPTTEKQRDAEGVYREALVVRGMDACDGMLAEERLEDAEWVNWSDVKRDLQRQD